VNDSGKKDALVGELKGMLDASAIADTVFNTGNMALDVVLTEKSRICLKNKISFSVMADGKQLNKLSEIDIYSLIGNSLDNAIEATRRIKDEDARVISFYLRRENGVVSIHVENTFIADTKFVGGIPQTIKDDKRMHGFGVKSMINIAKKYNGNLTLKQENGVFYLDIIIPT
jgi:sensor histidine kinase regulating citrate/malate metabolism